MNFIYTLLTYAFPMTETLIHYAMNYGREIALNSSVKEIREHLLSDYKYPIDVEKISVFDWNIWHDFLLPLDYKMREKYSQSKNKVWQDVFFPYFALNDFVNGFVKCENHIITACDCTVMKDIIDNEDSNILFRKGSIVTTVTWDLITNVLTVDGFTTIVVANNKQSAKKRVKR